MILLRQEFLLQPRVGGVPVTHRPLYEDRIRAVRLLQALRDILIVASYLAKLGLVVPVTRLFENSARVLRVASAIAAPSAKVLVDTVAVSAVRSIMNTVPVGVVMTIAIAVLLGAS
ncbi:hypothetical protein FI667_g3069, partial [Globisporangium splendens]